MTDPKSSSLEHLIDLLVEECSNRPELKALPKETITEIVYSLDSQIFAEDDRKKSISALNNILNPIVETIYQEEKP